MCKLCVRDTLIYCARDFNNRGYYIRLLPDDSRAQSGRKKSDIYSCAPAIAMMMRWRWIERKKRVGERTSRGTERETRKNKSKKITSIREAAVCVDALDSSRVHMCNGRALPLGCITRRDLYSRLTSLCEGRIRSDTRHSCVTPFLSSLFGYSLRSSPIVLPWLPALRHSLSTLPSSSRLREGPIRQL